MRHVAPALILLLSGCGLLLDPGSQLGGAPDASIADSGFDAAMDAPTPPDAMGVDAVMDGGPRDAPTDGGGMTDAPPTVDAVTRGPRPVIDTGGYGLDFAVFAMEPGSGATTPIPASVDKVYVEMSEEMDPALLAGRLSSSDGVITDVPIVDSSMPDFVFFYPPGPLANGWYCLEVYSSLSVAGRFLDGEYLGRFPSGDGSDGGTFVYVFGILAGDLNGDRWVDTADVMDFDRGRGTYRDLDGDGTIGDADRNVIINHLGMTIDAPPSRLVGDTCPSL